MRTMRTMKKIALLVIILITSIQLNAQSTTPVSVNSPEEIYFIGKWELMVFGLPEGDTKMLFVVEKNSEGKLSGYFTDDKGAGKDPVTKIVINKNKITVNFVGGGYDCYMYLDKKDDKNVTGSMMDMFDITGVKVVEATK
jgi:hypothetical protein